MPRLPDEVLVTVWLVTALMRLNSITAEQADKSENHVGYRLCKKGAKENGADVSVVID